MPESVVQCFLNSVIFLRFLFMWKDSEEHTLFLSSKKGLVKAEQHQRWPPFMVVTRCSLASHESCRDHNRDEAWPGQELSRGRRQKTGCKGFDTALKQRNAHTQIKQKHPKYFPRSTDLFFPDCPHRHFYKYKGTEVKCCICNFLSDSPP